MSALPPPPPPRRLPDAVAMMLRTAHDSEGRALGSDRRAAFRLTRTLLGGARTAGYATTELASCLGVSAAAVRGRGGSDGWVSVSQLSGVAGTTDRQIRGWREANLLTQHCRNSAGEDCYLASEVVRLLGQRTQDALP